MTRTLPSLALLTALVAPAAQAGETRCWMDQGVLVVPASVAGAAGDYILDTAAPRTVLHETRAQSEGYAGADLTGDVRLAGQNLRDRPVGVADLDARTWTFPTPIAGVIGADVLSAYVVDIQFAPCRVRLSRPGKAPSLRGGQILAFAQATALPTVTAAVSDGPRASAGAFLIATGGDAALRLATDRADAPGAAKPGELLPYGSWRARLRAASLAGGLWENLNVGLIAATDLPSGALGEIGPPILASWRMRIDYPRREMTLWPSRTAPPRP